MAAYLHLSFFILLLVINGVYSDEQDVFCVVRGNITENGTLDGTFEPCYPEYQCELPHGKQMALDVSNIICYDNLTTNETLHYCAYRFVDRRQFCASEQDSCYKIHMVCDKSFRIEHGQNWERIVGFLFLIVSVPIFICILICCIRCASNRRGQSYNLTKAERRNNNNMRFCLAGNPLNYSMSIFDRNQTIQSHTESIEMGQF